MGKNTTLGKLQFFAGRYGRIGIKCALKGKKSKNPLEIFCHACALLNIWTGLFAENDKKQLEEGLSTMLQIAKDLLAVQPRNNMGERWTWEINRKMVKIQSEDTAFSVGFWRRSGS